MDENNNIEVSTSLSSDLSNRGKITIQLEELLVAGNYDEAKLLLEPCLLYTSPSPRDKRQSRMPSSA